jgi:hypothetical protein
MSIAPSKVAPESTKKCTPSRHVNAILGWGIDRGIAVEKPEILFVCNIYESLGGITAERDIEVSPPDWQMSECKSTSVTDSCSVSALAILRKSWNS